MSADAHARRVGDGTSRGLRPPVTATAILLVLPTSCQADYTQGRRHTESRRGYKTNAHTRPSDGTAVYAGFLFYGGLRGIFFAMYGGRSDRGLSLPSTRKIQGRHKDYVQK